MKRFPVSSLLTVAALSTLVACGTADGASAGGPQVVTSVYPLHYIAERVAGGNAEVTNLTSPGVEPHDLELSVAQSAQVSDADVAFYLSGFQPAVDDAIAHNRPDVVIDAAEVVDLAPGGDHADESEEEPAEHEHGAEDPHFWLDPERYRLVAQAFSEEMGRLDPDNRDAYSAAYEELATELDRLDVEYRKGLADCERDTVVVSHDAFGYLEKYGLHFVSINGLSPDAEPSPGHIAELHDLIRTEGITTVFSETLASPAMAEALATDLGLETDVLDPIEGLSDATEGEDYLSLMRSNLAALQEANSCS